MTDRPPLTLEKQADLIRYLIGRMLMCDGTEAKEAWMLIEKQDLEDLRHIEQRLRRMAPHEAAIKRVVMGK